MTGFTPHLTKEQGRHWTFMSLIFLDTISIVVDRDNLDDQDSFNFIEWRSFFVLPSSYWFPTFYPIVSWYFSFSILFRNEPPSFCLVSTSSCWRQWSRCCYLASQLAGWPGYSIRWKVPLNQYCLSYLHTHQDNLIYYEKGGITRLWDHMLIQTQTRRTTRATQCWQIR